VAAATTRGRRGAVPARLSIGPRRTRRRRTRWSTCSNGGRGAEAAALLEKTLTWAADISTMFEVWAREKIVSIYADELGEPDKAAEHQRRLVELTPKDVGRRVRLADIEMCPAPAASRHAVDNLLALADLAAIPRWRSR
jgi:hypothetical protein